jgi:hypothetical protein
MATLGPNVLNVFTAVIYEFFNRLECLSLAGLSSLVKGLWEGQEPTQVKPLAPEGLNCGKLVKHYISLKGQNVENWKEQT